MARISRSLLDRILALAAAEPAEICGLLLGEGDRVEAIAPTANVARHPMTEFEIDPAALIAAHREARRGGPVIVGHYHSHPGGMPDPSPTDAAAALPDGALWLIIGGGQARLWRAGADGLHGRFRAEPLRID